MQARSEGMSACLSLDYLDRDELELDELPRFIVAETEAQTLELDPDQWLDEALSDGELAEHAEHALRLGDPFWDLHSEHMLRSSCALFAAEVLSGPHEAPYNGHFLVAQHHDEWDDLVLEHRRLCVLAPRDHGKSFYFDFAYPIWQAWRNPNKAGFIFSATKEQAVRILGDIKAEFESNPRLSYLVPSPGSKRRWSSTLIELNNGHKIYARGYGTKVRGAHPIWIVVDDGLNDETIYSDLVRTKQIEYFHTAISNMCTPDGQIIVVGTPFHSADLYADLSENPEYFFKRYSALDSSGRPLWAERYSYEALQRKKREIGEIRFAREFQCDPVSDDMSLFPLYLFQGELVEQPTLTLGMPLEFWRALGVSIYMGVDFAMSASASADYTVIWTMGRDAKGNRWLIDIFRDKGMSYQAQLSKINEIGKQYEPALVFLEANQMQRIFGDELIRTTDLPVRKFTTTAEKNTLEKGVPSLRVLLENTKFRIPRGDRRSVELTNEWIKEMRAVTFQDGKVVSVGTHDDTVMACWICDQAIRAGGFSFDFGDDVDLRPEAVKALVAELTGDTAASGGGTAATAPGSTGDGGPSNGGASEPPVASLVDPDAFQVHTVRGGLLGAPRARSLLGY